MRQLKQDVMPGELITAIGLVWGHLNSGRYDKADQLVRGFLEVWPDQEHLNQMAVFASVELGTPLNAESRAVLMRAESREWTEMVLRRAGEKAMDKAAAGRHHKATGSHAAPQPARGSRV